MIAHALALIATAAAVAALLYTCFALFRLGRMTAPRAGPNPHQPPLTVLKPVCGLDYELYENLASFCAQDYPHYQVIFCATSSEDTALPVVRRVIAEHPELDLQVAIGAAAGGANGKIANLVNALPLVRHDLLVIADSDMRVDRRYLSCIAQAFDAAGTGAVTCLYKGAPAPDLPSRLAAMYINESFLPSVLVATAIEPLRYCFGATMAVSRQALEEIGGLTRLGEFLADDYMLGKLVSDRGWRVRLAPCVVENRVHEASLGHLLHHEVRWGRTMRSARPLGYGLSILSQPLPLALGVVALAPTSATGLVLAAAAIALRVAVHYRARRSLGLTDPARPWLVPLRDLLCFGVWLASLGGRRVRWRDSGFQVAADGRMTRMQGSLP